MGDGSGFQVGEDAPRHYQTQVKRFMDPFVEAMVGAVVSPGDDVLDVACGTGIATRAAASVVGPSGSVVGSDINAAMVAFARQASGNAWPQIGWEEASAHELPFDDNCFDTVICQQGLQFFPDPGDCLTEMARVTRAGGKLAVTVWSDLARSPYFEVLFEMLIRYAYIEPEDVAAVFPEGHIPEWFETAGLLSPTIDLIDAPVTLPPLQEYVPAHMKALPWGPSFFALPEASQTEAVEHIQTRLGEYETDNGVVVPFSSYLATTSL